MNLTDKLDEIKKLIESVWIRNGIYKEHLGERVFLVQKDDEKICIFFSDKKMKQVDQHLSTDENVCAHQCWDEKEKVIPFDPPQPPEFGDRQGTDGVAEK